MNIIGRQFLLLTTYNLPSISIYMLHLESAQSKQLKLTLLTLGTNEMEKGIENAYTAAT